MKREKSKSSKKNYLKSIRGFFRSFDFFGEYLAFRYKDEDKQSSVLGGIVCIVFYIIAIVYFIYNLIPFIKHDIFKFSSIIRKSDMRRLWLALRKKNNYKWW